MPKITRNKKVKKFLEPAGAGCHENKKVQSKMNDGDFKEAIRIPSSDDAIAPFKLETYLQLLERHPEPNIPQEIDDSAEQDIPLVLEAEVKIAILSFASGSSGGRDGLRPQHVKGMITKENAVNGEHANKLLRILSTFCKTLLKGKAPSFVTPIL